MVSIYITSPRPHKVTHANYLHLPSELRVLYLAFLGSDLNLAPLGSKLCVRHRKRLLVLGQSIKGRQSESKYFLVCLFISNPLVQDQGYVEKGRRVWPLRVAGKIEGADRRMRIIHQAFGSSNSYCSSGLLPLECCPWLWGQLRPEFVMKKRQRNKVRIQRGCVK